LENVYPGFLDITFNGKTKKNEPDKIWKEHMAMKSLRLIFMIFLLGVLLTIPIRYGWSEDTSATSLDSLIVEALRNNPEIQAAYHNWKAAEHKIKQVTALPDPMLGYGYFGENIETRVGPQEQRLGLSQKIPFPGKLRGKGQVQSKHADLLKEKYEGTKREVKKSVKLVYYDLFWVDRAIQVINQEKTILENLETVARRKYESNLAPLQDVLKTQVEISKLIYRLYLLSQNRKSLTAKMNALLNRSGDAEQAETQQVEPTELKYGLDELREMAQSSRQELLAAAIEIEKSKYERSLAKLDYYPDFTFGLDYIQIGSGRAGCLDGEDIHKYTGMVR